MTTALSTDDFNEALPKELVLFSVPPVQTGVEKIYYVDCRPVSQISGNGPVEFHISGQTSDYLDLRKSLLYIKVRILKHDNSPLGNNEAVAFVNMPLQSLWGQVDVSLQGKLLSGNSGNYAYKSYIQTLLNFGISTKRSQLTSQLYFQDTPNSMDDADPDVSNSGVFERYEFSKNSMSVDLIGPIGEDLCKLDRYILNGIDVDIKLYKNHTAFALVSSEVNPNYHIELQEVMFRACHVQVNPGVLVGHGKVLEIAPAKYLFVRTDIKTASIPAGQTTFIWDNIYQTKLPSKVVIGLVTADAYTGSYVKNPFNFQPFDASSVGVYVNNISVPTRPHKLDFSSSSGQCYITAFRSLFESTDKADLDSDNVSVPTRPHKLDFSSSSGQCYITAFRSLFESTDKADLDSDNAIDRDDWPGGYSLYGFQLQPQFGTEQYLSLTHQASVRLEISFASALSETVTCIIYSEFNELFEVDKTRNVIWK